MVDLNINIPDGFLDEETRGGYTITRQMKEVWAIELDLLNEFERVCKKYHLSHFADSGTLIGAVRENGFIPWDDDIDLVMPRDDYNKLLEISNEEFQYPYFLQNAYSEKEIYIRAHSQLRNSNTTGCIKTDLNRNINRGIFIDIFPLDALPNDKLKYKIFKNRIKIWWLLLEHKYDEGHSLKGKILHFLLNFFPRTTNFKTAFNKYETYCSSNSNQCKTMQISYIAYSKGKEKHIWKSEWFAETKICKFEFIDIPIPAGYDERLRKEYGDYMAPCTAPSAHGEVLFDTDRSYKEILLND